MKTTGFFHSSVYLLFLFFSFELKSQTYSPVPVTGFNFDGIAEAFPNSTASTSGPLDLTNHVLYSQTFATNAGIGGGIANSGTITNGLDSYQLQPFNTNNLFKLTGGSGNLSFTIPSSFQSISLLAFSTEGPSDIRVTLNFATGPSSNYGIFNVKDWFFGTGAVYSGCGRILRATGGSYTAIGLPSDPRFYPVNINLSCADRLRTLQSITINHTSGSFVYVAAVSGALNPTINASNSFSTICLGNLDTLSAISSINGGTYSWNPGGGNGSQITVNPASTTTYTCTYTYIGCSYTATATVTVIPAFTANAGADDTLCFGSSKTLSVTPNGVGYSYSWTPTIGTSGATTSSPVVSPSSTTTYSVIVTDTNGCNAFDSVTIYMNSQIFVTINTTNVICNGACNGQVAANVSGGAAPLSYLWNSGCTTSVCSSLCSGTYIVTITDAWGCKASASTVVTEPAAISMSLTNSNLASCNGTCDGTAIALANGGTIGSGYYYSWTTIPTQFTNSAVGLCAGSYTCTVTDANGCTQSQSISVSQLSGPAATINSDVTITMGTSTILTASGGSTYNWINSSGLNCTSCSNPIANPAQTTTYCVEVSDSIGCKDTACVLVIVETPCQINDSKQVPNAFSPNDDQVNDAFCLQGWDACAERFNIVIVNRFGEKVFESTNPNFCWDGKYLNQPMDPQVLVYIIKAKYTGTNKLIEKKGNISLLR